MNSPENLLFYCFFVSFSLFNSVSLLLLLNRKNTHSAKYNNSRSSRRIMEFCVFISCEMCFLAEILRCAWSHCLVDVDENALTFSHSERETFDRNERSLALNR